MYDQWRTDCPKCGEEELVVTEVTLAATGKKHSPDAPLMPDGFEVDPGFVLDLKDYSTEDERVKCSGCGAEFDLCDLEHKA